MLLEMSSGPVQSLGRQKCFLCEVPRGPWAMLYDFVEPVCRACCNYEGIDRIAEVIDKARQLRRSFESPAPCAPMKPDQLVSPSTTAEVMILPAAINAGMNRPPLPTGPRPPYAVLPRPPVETKMHHVVAPTTAPHYITQPNFTCVTPVSVAVPKAACPTPPVSSFAVHHHKIESVQTLDTTTQRFAQIQDTLTVLAKTPPFRVRFSKDHSLVGRVIAFDAVCRGSDYELKVFIEYPIGSGTVFQSASGAGRQMYGEFRERLGIGGGFRGASSNGYKDLEYEKEHGSEEWRMLGELLTEEVRFFRGPVKKELPTPFVDPQHPVIPPATLNTTRGFLRNNLVRKRRSSNEDAFENGGEARKERRVVDNGGSDPVDSPKSEESPSMSPLNGTGAPTSPTTTGSPGHGSPKSSPRHNDLGMVCMACHRTLEDTRFVQCPSKPSHKFCFSCSRDSIRSQSTLSCDVYCPSGLKCLVAGSATPWAFMEQEIATILETNS